MAMATDTLATTETAGEVLAMLYAPDRPLRQDPYPAYARLRELTPVTQSPLTGAWVVSTADGVLSVLRDGRMSAALATKSGWSLTIGASEPMLQVLSKVLLFM